MVINLEDWDKDKEYDRLGLEGSLYRVSWKQDRLATTFPIRPGRNLAIIVESAAVKLPSEEDGL